MNGTPYLQAVQGAGRRAGRTYPAEDSDRCHDDALFPAFTAKFHLPFAPSNSVFTIGSCFARNIEEALFARGVDLPTRRFNAPQEEWPGRGNGLLNEYNPGTMAQRILHALAGQAASEATLIHMEDSVHDLLLPAMTGVSEERARARRAEIDAVYASLPHSGAVIMTLGFVECWYDNAAHAYLNRVPPRTAALADPARFELRRLDVEGTFALMQPAMAALCDAGARTVLTVSPVPIRTTFTADDCVVANEYSKSVLRVVADRLCRQFDRVDYFPSYEIVRSGGIASYNPDNVHVRNDLVRLIVRRMVKAYTRAEEDGAGSVPD